MAEYEFKYPFIVNLNHPSILTMICVNGVWVWIGEYYTDEYKIKGGIIDVKA